jgi:hypothetical protein
LTSHPRRQIRLLFLEAQEAARIISRTTLRYEEILQIYGWSTDGVQFGGSVAEATIDIRMAFVRKVYAIL